MHIMIDKIPNSAFMSCILMFLYQPSNIFLLVYHDFCQVSYCPLC
uniref:Uncharacterized protein n=1 Tax=Anguilla anguilla TaxID=7936 RepID=A0A0E9QDG3_ANGAN